MAYTLGLTGMSRQTEESVRAAFDIAKSRLGGMWSLAPVESASHVIIDMDSLYGPASFMQLHSAGKQVIALTDGARSPADFLVERANMNAALGTLLGNIAQGVAGSADMASASTQAPAPAEEIALDSAVSLPFDPPDATIAAVAPPRPEPAVTRPAATFSPAPTPADHLPDLRTLHPAQEPVATPVGQTAAPAVADMPAPPPAAARTDRPLHEWLRSNALPGKRLLQGSDGTTILIDLDNGTWLGSNALKPLSDAFGGLYVESDFRLANAHAVESHTHLFGTPQPLARLLWASGLGNGKGQLLAGYDPEAEYRLVKWPQTEREFPKHFRIATAMMKAPGTVTQIANAANVPNADVADFINANLVTGFAEVVGNEPPPAAEPPPSGGLLGRFRR